MEASATARWYGGCICIELCLRFVKCHIVCWATSSVISDGGDRGCVEDRRSDQSGGSGRHHVFNSQKLPYGLMITLV
jgi:hypothetical protein